MIFYIIAPDGRDWQAKLAKADILKGFEIIKILYRPFDERYTAYTGNSKGFLAYPRSKTSFHLLNKENVCLITCRQTKSNPGAYISSMPIDQKSFSAYDINTMFPLYLYPETYVEQSLALNKDRSPNLNEKIISTISQKINLKFVYEKEFNSTAFAPIDILDYMYAVLHSPEYKNRYREFLEIDFPRVPYPSDVETFWKLVALGSHLREIHLLESPIVNKPITQYPIDGANTVDDIKYENGKVWINITQYFAGVPEIAWDFYIGGYQPAQKWLKDRQSAGTEVDLFGTLSYLYVLAVLYKYLFSL